ncbi:MAG: Ig-like domain repeat protein, partial [Solirubrobacteraceae bacterium]
RSWFGPAASYNVYDATITVSDPSPPTFGSDFGSLAGRPAWVSAANAPGGVWSLTASASDPAGICGFAIAVSSQQDQDNLAPNYTYPAPCGAPSRPTTFYLNPCALADGSYTLFEGATNPAGMLGYGPLNGETINVDCTPPTTSVASAPSASSWYSGQQSVTFAGSDNFSGVAALSCNDGRHAGSSYTEVVTAQGTSTASCQAIDNAANVGGAVSATVHIDSQRPTIAFSGPSQSAWASGPQSVTATGSEPQPFSGIASTSCSLDGGAPRLTHAATQTVRVTGDGVHSIVCTATTGAGVTGAVATYTVQIDSQPPTLSFSGGPSQSTWATGAEPIEVAARDQPGLSGVAQIACTLAGLTTTYDAAQAHVTVQPPGGQLSCRAHDNAGNWSAPQAWSFLIDDVPPTGAFEPPNPQNPAHVIVQVADSASGVAGGQIQIEQGSGWQSLSTSFDEAAGTLSATIPDSGSIPDGTYQLRALVWDAAGNEATVTQDPSVGRPAAVTLPLRIVTRLLVGHAEVLQTTCRLRRRVVHRHLPLPHRGRRHVRGRHTGDRPGRPRHGLQPSVGGPRAYVAARLVRACASVKVPRNTGELRLRYGQRATISGLLETIDGTPLAGQSIAISQNAPRWSGGGAGLAETDSQGRFEIVLGVGPSRTVTFAYPGTDILRSTNATTGLLVVGRSTIEVGNSVRAGHRLQISGRLAGGSIPPGGVLVQLWYRVRGVPSGFAPFEHAIATNRRGRWSITFPVSRGARGYTYLFKAVVSRQADWPFLATTTRVVARHVG